MVYRLVQLDFTQEIEIECLQDVVGKFEVICQTFTLLFNCRCKSSWSTLQYLNDNKYPVPQTVLVTLIEMCKVTFTVIASRGRLPAFSRDNLKASLPYVAPSLIYALQGRYSVRSRDFTGL